MVQALLSKRDGGFPVVLFLDCSSADHINVFNRISMAFPPRRYLPAADFGLLLLLTVACRLCNKPAFLFLVMRQHVLAYIEANRQAQAFS